MKEREREHNVTRGDRLGKVFNWSFLATIPRHSFPGGDSSGVATVTTSFSSVS